MVRVERIDGKALDCPAAVFSVASRESLNPWRPREVPVVIRSFSSSVVGWRIAEVEDRCIGQATIRGSVDAVQRDSASAFIDIPKHQGGLLGIRVPLVEWCDHDSAGLLQVHSQTAVPVRVVGLSLRWRNVQPGAVRDEVFHHVTRSAVPRANPIRVGEVKCVLSRREDT